MRKHTARQSVLSPFLCHTGVGGGSCIGCFRLYMREEGEVWQAQGLAFSQTEKEELKEQTLL